MAAPWVFVTLVVLCSGGGWVIGRFMYGERISLLQDRITRRDETIVELKSQLALAPRSSALPLPPKRDPDAVYQYGEIVGLAANPKIRRNEGMLFFDAIEHALDLNYHDPIEFQDWQLSILHHIDVDENYDGKRLIDRAYIGVNTRILGKLA